MVAMPDQWGNLGQPPQIGARVGAQQQQAWPQQGLAELMAPGMPNYWASQAYAASQPQTAFWNFQGDLANADASRYATEAGLQGLLNRLPWEYANTVQQSASAADAAKQVGLYGMLGDIYPAAYQAWSQSTTAPEVARINADAATEAAGLTAWSNMMSSYYPAASGISQAELGAGASMYGAQQGALSNMMASYYPAASGITQAQIGAGAADLQSERLLEGQRVGAQSAENIAQTQAGANTRVAGLQAGANMGVAGLQAGANMGVAQTQAGAGRDIAQMQAGANVDVAGLQAGAGRDIAQTQAGANMGVAQTQAGAARYIADLQQQMALEAITARRGGLQMILDLIMPLMSGGPPALTPLATSYGAGYG